MSDVTVGSGISAGGDDTFWPPALQQEEPVVLRLVEVRTTFTGRKWLDFILGFLVAPCVFIASVQAIMALNLGDTAEIIGSSILVLAIGWPSLIGKMPWTMAGPSKHFRSRLLLIGGWTGTVLTLGLAFLAWGGDSVPTGCGGG